MPTDMRRYRTWRNIIVVVVIGLFALNADQAGQYVQAFSGADSAALQKQANLNPAATFGDKLAAAALERTNHFVIYNPKYMKIDYPNGDVPRYFGVCSDVVIRSYRALGIDLQKLVHERMGGDRNIAHRRVANLRRYFTRYGKSLKISKNPEDYKPGDIVTYHLDKSRYSNKHVAIVSSRKSLSGQPLIVHNIGLGPQLEDALFKFKITGHYRYTPKGWQNAVKPGAKATKKKTDKRG